MTTLQPILGQHHDGAVPARIVDLRRDSVPVGWKTTPAGEAGDLVVAYDPTGVEVIVTFGDLDVPVARALAASGYRPLGSAGDVTVHVRRVTPPAPPTTPPGQPLTITVEEAGRVLGISRGLAYSLAARGELPVIRLGRRMVVPTARLHELIADR
jgi:excisionase family DNA binding protein